jgi:hypothetical protein
LMVTYTPITVHLAALAQMFFFRRSGLIGSRFLISPRNQLIASP